MELKYLNLNQTLTAVVSFELKLHNLNLQSTQLFRWLMLNESSLLPLLADLVLSLRIAGVVFAVTVC